MLCRRRREAHRPASRRPVRAARTLARALSPCGLRIVQDVVHVQLMSARISLTLSTASGSFRAHSCASVCAFPPGLPEDRPEEFPQVVRKVFRVQIVVELPTQETFQRFKSARSHQTRFQAAPPKDLPLQGHHVGYQHLIDNIDRLYRRADTGEKLVIGGGVFALKEERRSKRRYSRGRPGTLAGAISALAFISLGNERHPTWT